MGSPSRGSIHEIIQLAHVLRSAGLEEEVMDALLTTPAIAQAAAEAATNAHRRNRGSMSAALDMSMVAEINLSTTSLPKREFNALRRTHIETLGDVALSNEKELRRIRGIGSKSIESIAEVLDEYGLPLPKESGRESARALELYGGSDFIPARQLARWAPALDKGSLLYLRKFETVGDLAVTSRSEFVEWRQVVLTPRESLEYESIPQSEIMSDGLAAVGHSFFGEE